MIKPKRMNAVMLTVRDIKKSMGWYREHFMVEDFEKAVVKIGRYL